MRAAAASQPNRASTIVRPRAPSAERRAGIAQQRRDRRGERARDRVRGRSRRSARRRPRCAMPPAGVLTSGVPEASASSTVFGRPSTLPLSSRTDGTTATSAAANQAPTPSCARSPRKRTRSATPAVTARARSSAARSPSPAITRCAGVRALDQRQRVDQVLEALLPDQPSGGEHQRRRRGECRAARGAEPRASGAGLKRDDVHAVRHDLHPIGGGAERDRARCARSCAAGRHEAGAREHAPRPPRARSACARRRRRPIRAGSRPAAATAARRAAMTPPGTTQCPCITVARFFCATRSALNQPAVIASGAAIHAAPLQLHVRAQPGRVAEHVQRRHRRVLEEVEEDAVLDFAAA